MPVLDTHCRCSLLEFSWLLSRLHHCTAPPPARYSFFTQSTEQSIRLNLSSLCDISLYKWFLNLLFTFIEITKFKESSNSIRLGTEVYTPRHPLVLPILGGQPLLIDYLGIYVHFSKQQMLLYLYPFILGMTYWFFSMKDEYLAHFNKPNIHLYFLSPLLMLL